MDKLAEESQPKRHCSDHENVSNGDEESQPTSSCNGVVAPAPLISPVAFGSTVSDQVFGNHLILKEIFKQFPTPELLQLSAVNKLWNSNARTILRDNKKCLVKIGSDKPCVDLKEFLSVISKSTFELPFNGLSITTRFYEENHHDCIDFDHDTETETDNTNNDPKELYSPLLNKLKIKYLKLGWDDEVNCPAATAIKKVLAEAAPYIEGLNFLAITPKLKSISKYFFTVPWNPTTPQKWFPKLKTLEIPCSKDFTHDDGRAHLVKELLCASPRLENFLGGIRPSTIEMCFTYDKIQAVREFWFQPGIRNKLDEEEDGEGDDDDEDNFDVANHENQIEKELQTSLKFAIEFPKLQKFTISTQHLKNRILENPTALCLQITEILQCLLENSYRTLEQLQLNNLDLILLQRIGIPSLRNVKNLLLSYNRELDLKEGFTTLARINFLRLFPSLQCIEFKGCHAEDLDFYVTDEFRENEFEYNCFSVTELSLGCGSNELEREDIFGSTVNDNYNFNDIKTFYAKIFPNVKHFRVDYCKNLRSWCTTLWTKYVWEDLESILFLRLDEQIIFENLDSIFTGISEEVCCSMRQSGNFDGFEKHQSEPSIRNLTKLKKLGIEIDHVSTCTKFTDDESWQPAFLSEVSGKCAFALMPELAVEIVRPLCKPQNMTKCRFEFEILNPYVTFVNSYLPKPYCSQSYFHHSPVHSSADSDDESNDGGW